MDSFRRIPTRVRNALNSSSSTPPGRGGGELF